MNRSLAEDKVDGGRAGQALPDPAQGARRRRRRDDAHAEGAPRLRRRALRAADQRRSTTARPRPTSPPRSPSRTAARACCRRASKIRDVATVPVAPRARRRRHESAGRQRHRRRRDAALDRERVAVVRRRDARSATCRSTSEGRGPRHHRPERRRQDLDAQRHQRLLSAAAGPHHLQGRDARPRCGPTTPRAAASRAPSRTSRCSRA